MSIPTVTTARLVLRAFTDEDIDPLHLILGDASVLRFFPNPAPWSRERVEEMVSEQRNHWEHYGYGWWAVQTRAGNACIGWCGLQFLPETNEVEVAYLLGRAYWGQGLATEAALASLRWGLEALALDRIVAIVDPENLRSQRVIEKLGLAFAGEARYFGMDCLRYEIGQHPRQDPASLAPEQ
jgi:ribosomal-protein-alanine N-acetyltransferase